MTAPRNERTNSSPSGMTSATRSPFSRPRAAKCAPRRVASAWMSEKEQKRSVPSGFTKTKPRCVSPESCFDGRDERRGDEPAGIPSACAARSTPRRCLPRAALRTPDAAQAARRASVRELKRDGRARRSASRPARSAPGRASKSAAVTRSTLCAAVVFRSRDACRPRRRSAISAPCHLPISPSGEPCPSRPCGRARACSSPGVGVVSSVGLGRDGVLPRRSPRARAGSRRSSRSTPSRSVASTPAR